MAYFFSPIGNSQIVDANGDPLVGGTISTFLAGTSTAETTYTDDTGGTAQGVVMTLNSLGYPENGPVWMLGGVPLKFIIKNAAGVTQSTFDDVSGIGDTATTADQWILYGAAPTYISAVSFSVVGDQTNTFQVGRRLKSTNSGGTVYSTISDSSFAAGVTTVTVTNTSGVLDSDLSAVRYSLLTAENDAVPAILPNVTTLAGLISTGFIKNINDFRLTLTTAVPITTTDVTGATTIYAAPLSGNSIALYDGSSKWNVRQSAQFSLALGTLTSGLPYDVFCYDNAGVPTLEFTAWTNGTTRATALAYQDGVLCKTGALTRRYLGTFYTTSTTATEDSKSKRYLFNYYHRKARFLERNETTANWTYSTATWRQSNGAVANQVNWFTGVVEDGVEVNAIATVQTNNGLYHASAIGINSITVPTGQFGTTGASSSTSYPTSTMPSQYRGMPQLGLNYAALLEWSQGGATTTWYGQSNDASTQTQTGITATVMQ